MGANYAVQVALRHAEQSQRQQLLDLLLPLPCLLNLSTSKHGSNVAEAIISQMHDWIFSASAEKDAAGQTDELNLLTKLLDHPFGNYVLQTVMRCQKSAERRADAFHRIRAATSTTNYGRSVLAKLNDKLVEAPHHALAHPTV